MCQDTIEGTPNKDANRTGETGDSDGSGDDSPNKAGGEEGGVQRAQARKDSAGSLGRTLSEVSSASRADLFPFGVGSVNPPPLAFEVRPAACCQRRRTP